MRRLIETHKTGSGDLNDQLEVACMDRPSKVGGGACHVYEVAAADDPMRRFARIAFQHGPIKEHSLNGCSDESLLSILIDRLEHFQAGPHACDDNAETLVHLENALECMHERTKKRIAANVEGTNAQADEDPPKKKAKKKQKKKKSPKKSKD